MQEEIFRFSIIRNPQRLSSEKLKLSIIQLIDEDKSNYPFYSKLIGLAKNRDKLIAFAKQSINSKSTSILRDLSQLKSKLVEYDEWIKSQKKLEGDKVINKAGTLFGNLPEFVNSKNFKQDKFQISDSIVIASITKPKINGLRSELMNARRLIFLIETLVLNSNIKSTEIKKILKANIILPCDLFPIPDKNESLREENEKAKKTRKQKIEKVTSEINTNLEKTRLNNEAIDELSKAYSQHLFELKHSKKNNDRNESKLSFIPTTKFKRLSTNTKNLVTKGLGINEANVDVAYTINVIESKNNQIATALIHDVVGSGDFFRDDNVAVITKDRTNGACKVILIEEDKKDNNFTGRTRGKVNQVLGQDLLIVQQKLLKYETGEIAHIENILKGEKKSKQHRKLHRVEETVFEESEKSQEVENELETTDRFELQSESSKTISEDTSRDAGVTVTSSYGPVTVEAQGNYSSSTATEESRNSSTTYAKDVVSRSLNKINERVLKRRSRTEVNEVEIINKHKIDNTKTDAENIAGIYRWVNKLYEAQVVNYGKRTMLEFMIPEPAAFYRYACDNHKENDDLHKPEEPGFCNKGIFIPLKPTDLTAANYMFFVGKYGVSDVQPPPAIFVFKSGAVTFNFSPDSSMPKSGEKEGLVNIPKNYMAIGAEYIVAAGHGHELSGAEGEDGNPTKANYGIRMAVGNNIVLSEQGTSHDEGNFKFDNKLSLNRPKTPSSPTDENIPRNAEVMLDNEEGSINISISYASDIFLFGTLNVAVKCQRKDEAVKQWQIDTFNAIMNAYNILKVEYEEAIESQEFDNEINIQGRNPFINREIEKTELKKHVISILTGQQYEGFNAMWQDHRQGFGYPEIDLKDAEKEGEFVQFFEQALEWKHATYLFYDYFWGRKQNWVETLKMKDTDPLFEKFLKAGYARIWVPVRPGFDSVIGNYICAGGEPWTEKDAPLCCNQEGIENPVNQKPILSMIEEIKEQLDNDYRIREGTISVANDSKEVTGTGTDFSEDDIDREILINLESYRIAEFVSTDKIILREPYKGDTVSGIGVSMGVKYVGEPWVVEVPTSLVHLQDDGELN